MSKTKPKWQPGKRPPADLAHVARRVVWFKSPKAALADPVHFLCHLMMYTTLDDLEVTCRYFSHADFQHAFDNAPRGILDAKSWTFWSLMLERPAPRRRRGSAAAVRVWPGQ